MNNLINKHLNGTLDEKERQELLAWLKEDYSNREHFLRLRSIWITAQYRGEDIGTEKEFEKLRDELTAGRKRGISLKRLYIASAGVAASLILALFLINKSEPASDIVEFANNNPVAGGSDTETTLILSPEQVVVLDRDEASINYNRDSVNAGLQEAIPLKESAKYNQLIVPYGKRSSVTFSDGTKLWANAGTRLVYPAGFDSKKREIFVDGEVYLDVQPDKSNPFIVKTRNMEVEVLGTEFGITDYGAEGDCQVVLVSGAVEVNNIPDGESFRLQPSQMYSDNGTKGGVDRVDVEKYVSWIDGIYLFDREPLGNVLSKLSKFYNVKIECNDRSIEYLCSGTLHLDMDLDSILTGLTYSIPVQYTRIGEKYQVGLK